MNISQRIANRVFEYHGEYTVNRRGNVELEHSPIVKNRLARFGNILLGAANVGITSAIAYGASKHNIPDTEVLMSAWAVTSAVYTGMFVYDDLHAANLSLPNTVDPSWINTTGQQQSEQLSVTPIATE